MCKQAEPDTGFVNCQIHRPPVCRLSVVPAASLQISDYPCRRFCRLPVLPAAGFADCRFFLPPVYGLPVAPAAGLQIAGCSSRRFCEFPITPAAGFADCLINGTSCETHSLLPEGLIRKPYAAGKSNTILPRKIQPVEKNIIYLRRILLRKKHVPHPRSLFFFRNGIA